MADNVNQNKPSTDFQSLSYSEITIPNTIYSVPNLEIITTGLVQ